jgi:hypothetical protein
MQPRKSKSPFFLVRNVRNFTDTIDLRDHIANQRLARIVTSDQIGYIEPFVLRSWTLFGHNRLIITGTSESGTTSSIQFFRFDPRDKSVSIISNVDSPLRFGSTFVCVRCNVKFQSDRRVNSDEKPLKALGAIDPYHQYVYHRKPDPIWLTRYGPYVNADRDSNSIGYSSWCGNLVDWFRADPATRMRYGQECGLYGTDGSYYD